MDRTTRTMSHPDAAPGSVLDTKAIRGQLRAWALWDARGLRRGGWLGLLDGLCIGGFAWGLSHMVSDLFQKNQSLIYLWPSLALTVISLAVRAIIGLYNQKLGMETARRIVSHIRLDIMEKALAGRVDSARHQARLNALFEDTESLEGYYARFRQADLSARVLPLVFIAVMAIVSPVSAGILLLTLLPFVALMAILGMTSADESKRQLDALSRLSNLFVDRIRALPLILSFDAGPRQVGIVGRAARDVAERTLRVLKIAFVTSAVLEFFSALSVALIAIYCGFYLLGQLPFPVPEVLTLAKAFFVLALAPEVYAPMRRLAAAYHDQQTAMAAAQRLMALDISPDIAAQPALKDAPEVTYDAVTCTFPDDPDFRIGPVSFTARPGQVVALKGPTGSGKTTLLRLLLGHGRHEGAVRVNGQPLIDLSRSIAWVSQNPPILAGSLADNLNLANRQADPNEVIEKFGLNTLVITRESALSAPIDERGSGLSGGERRKIGLARAALKAAPLWVLDEPTADLDPAAEADLIARLPDLFKGRTVILSSHSPALCALADRVVEL
ncbi:thiol reductant ABC exporter subunit CydD [Asticcacaulis sp. 201]|uniref:thiol reductant ABC exporter subunit CydD n=1 Tax=Asticcacaulis sp. 201 TaxID=3028787 RepID=UPI00291694FD|nr:thiol reductant ABC exporter subunit CydD [Asticcacaulis sp. 201]MDV6330437.1 thiol reductant ABC exporter subunit CydD [Asticcacaulis sp. 201]